MDELLEKFAEVPKQQRFAALIAVLFALVGAYYYMFYETQSADLEFLQGELSKKQSTRSDKENKAQNKAMYIAKNNEAQKKLEEAASKLPDTADVASLLAQLGNRGQQSGLAIREFNPGKEKVGGNFAELPFSLQIKGSYHEVGVFVDSLSKLERIMNVTDLKLSKPKTEGGKIRLDGSMTVKTYRFLSDKEKNKGKKKKK